VIEKNNPQLKFESLSRASDRIPSEIGLQSPRKARWIIHGSAVELRDL
jgi:hypothetical protein